MKTLVNKLALGSAQLGMDYGINNIRGIMRESEAIATLDNAVRSGIDTVDTASAYGQSEVIIGKFIKSYRRSLKVISKLPKCGHETVKQNVAKSLSNLGVHGLYGYLVHDFESYKRDRLLWKELESIRREGSIKKIGFSVYYPQELDLLIKDALRIDLIQIPFSIFDQRFAPYLDILKKKGIEIHARSVFLQGLVFKKPDDLAGYFDPVKTRLGLLAQISKRADIPIHALCLNFVAANNAIDKILIGVDSTAHLKGNISALAYEDRVEDIYEELQALKEDDETMLVPALWSR